MSTEFNFPANPTLNQQVTLPNGSVAQWNGTEWVSVGDSTVTYPLTIPLGGTGATTAAQARINLGLNTDTGEFVVQKDGTVTAPGIAFASEPGLGWYRTGTNVLRLAAAGFNVVSYGLSDPAVTYVGHSPRVAGRSQISLEGQPVGAAGVNVLHLQGVANGPAIIGTSATGTATRQNLTIDAPLTTHTGPVSAVSAIDVNAVGAGNWSLFNLNTQATGGAAIQGKRAGLSRWSVTFPDGTADGAGNSGGDFRVARYDNAGAWLSEPFVILRSNGNAAFNGVTVAIGNYLGSTLGAQGEVDILPAATTTSTPAWPALNGGMIVARGNGNPSYASGAVTCYSGSGNTGVTLGAGQGAWGAVSDERLKAIEGDITDGLEAVLAMRPIRFHYKTDAPGTPLRVGLSAQSVQLHVPEAVSKVPLIGKDQKLTAETYLNLRITEVIPHLVSAIQTLNQRLTALE